VLSQVPDKATWLAPPVFLAWLIAALAIFGLGLLWLMDQFVYQRLLIAAFVSGILLEHRRQDLPPMRALMLAVSGGMSRYLRLFYFAPMTLFWTLGLGTIIADACGGFGAATRLPNALFVVLVAGSVATAGVLALLLGLSGKVGSKAVLATLEIDPLKAALEKPRLLQTIKMRFEGEPERNIAAE